MCSHPWGKTLKCPQVKRCVHNWCPVSGRVQLITEIRTLRGSEDDKYRSFERCDQRGRGRGRAGPITQSVFGKGMDDGVCHPQAPDQSQAKIFRPRGNARERERERENETRRIIIIIGTYEKSRREKGKGGFLYRTEFLPWFCMGRSACCNLRPESGSRFFSILSSPSCCCCPAECPFGHLTQSPSRDVNGVIYGSNYTRRDVCASEPLCPNPLVTGWPKEKEGRKEPRRARKLG